MLSNVMKETGIRIRKVEYYQQIKPPTLNQYLYRRYVKHTMSTDVRGEGIGVDIDTGKPVPLTAIQAKAKLTGVTAADVRRMFPKWVDDYKEEYGE